MIDNTLCEKMLHPALIIHKYVIGETKCNYELYITELINKSSVFMKKTEGKPLCYIESQSHGEPDASSENYSIDYKLLATRSSLQGLRETSNSITKLCEGVYIFGSGRWPLHKQFSYIRMAAALRSYLKEDIERIAQEPSGRIEQEISKILKNLRIKKNLLLFYPYVFSFTEYHSFEDGCKSISDAFNEDLNCLRLYRKRKANGYDTFLCAIYDKRLIIFEDTGECWMFKESVELRLSKTYMELIQAYGNNGLFLTS